MWIIVSALLSAHAQEPPEHLFQKGMVGLTTWSIANFATDGLPAMYATDPEWKAYHQMNVGWNTVNFALAGVGLLRNAPIEPQKISRIFWINCVLDVAYVTGGLILRNQGIQQNNPKWLGWGNSIALQGSFLLVFDGVMGWKFQQYK